MTRWFALLFLVLSSCTRSIDPQGPSRPRWLSWVTAELPRPSDWTQCSDRACWQHAALVMEGLTRAERAGEYYVARPALALSWTEENAQKFLFTLRDRKWSDGTLLTADDFVDSWKQILKQCRQQTHAAFLLSIRGAKDYCEGKPTPLLGLFTVAKNKIQVITAQPQPLLPLWLSHPVAWPRRDRAGDVTLGPFLLSTWVSGLQAVYTRYMDYDGPRGNLDGVRIRALKDPALRHQDFLEGASDFAEAIPPELASRVDSVTSLARERFGALVFPQGEDSKEVRRWVHQVVRSEELAHSARLTLLPARAFTWPLGEGKGPRETKPLPLLRLDAVPRVAAVAPTEANPTILESLDAQLVRAFILGQRPTAKLKPSTLEGMPLNGSSTVYYVELTWDPFVPWRHLEKVINRGAALLPTADAQRLEEEIRHMKSARTWDELFQALDTVERWLVVEQARLVPLFLRAEVALRRHRMSGLVGLPLGVWDVREVALDGG